MFGKSFSQAAVAKAAMQIRYYESNMEMLFEAFPPELTTGWATTKEGRKPNFASQHRDDVNISLPFAHGVIVAVCDHYFDGKSKHLDDFQKKVIYEAFNYGFMMNMGKTVYQGFVSRTHNGSPYHILGLQWAKRFYIENIIINGVNVADYLRIVEAKKTYHEEKYSDPDYAERFLESAKISKENHLLWCLGTAKEIEKDFFQIGHFSESLMKKFNLSEGSPNFSRADDVYEFYSQIVSYSGLTLQPEIRKLYDWSYVDETDEPDSDLNSRAKFKKDLQLSIESRFELYKDLWEFERKREYSILFDPDLSEKVSNLDIPIQVSDELDSDNNKELRSDVYSHILAPDLEFLFETLGTIFHVLKGQGVNSNIGFLIPVEPSKESFLSYPAYDRVPFFGIASKIIKNNLGFNFDMADKNFPQFGRTVIDNNLALTADIFINLEDNQQWIFNMDLRLSPGCTCEEIITRGDSNSELIMMQDWIGLQNEIEKKYYNSASHVFVTSLKERVSEWSKFEDGAEGYRLYNDEFKLYDFLKANYNKLREKHLFGENQVADLLRNCDLKVFNPAPADFSLDGILSIYPDIQNRRKTMVEGQGIFFDDLEMFVINKFCDLGVPLQPRKLKKGRGFVPVTLNFALKLERLFAYLGDTDLEKANFSDLLYDLDEDPF